jgi:DNA-binding winged helix-turn-helix (wHTH) protein
MSTEVLNQVSKEHARRNPDHPGRQDGSTSNPPCLRFGEYELDLQQRQLSKAGLPVKVPGKVCQVLMALAETPGELVTREALRTRLWPRDTRLNYDANVNTTVNKLRQILGDTNEESKFIETIPRKGYRFIAKVECAERPAASSRVAATNRMELVWKFAGAPDFLRLGPARVWFTASVIALVIAAVLFGAAITLYSHRSLEPHVVSGPEMHTTPPTSSP